MGSGQSQIMLDEQQGIVKNALFARAQSIGEGIAQGSGTHSIGRQRGDHRVLS
jgi:hypothetical protein